MKIQKFAPGTAPIAQKTQKSHFRSMLPLVFTATTALFAIGAARANVQASDSAKGQVPAPTSLKTDTTEKKDTSTVWKDTTKVGQDGTKAVKAPAEPAIEGPQDRPKVEFDEKDPGWIVVHGLKTAEGKNAPEGMRLDITAELREIGVPVSEAPGRMQQPKPIGPDRARLAFTRAKGSIVLKGLDTDIFVKVEMGK